MTPAFFLKCFDDDISRVKGVPTEISCTSFELSILPRELISREYLPWSNHGAIWYGGSKEGEGIMVKRNSAGRFERLTILHRKRMKTLSFQLHIRIPRRKCD